jgi:hypothetical protein
MTVPTRTSSRSLALAVLLTLVPLHAHAFSEGVHRMLTERALRGVVSIGSLPNPSEPSLVKFWLWLGQALATNSQDFKLDGGDPERFRDRFPNPRAFDAWAVRGFLGLSQEPDRPVWGIEAYDKSAVVERFGVLIDASVRPDLDRRNQDRMAYDEKRQPLKLPDGRRVPADPMALNMGAPTGLSSQAHAHYQLGADHPSDKVETLQKEPWNFVMAVGFPTPRVETYAADMAQLHLDMAIMVKYWGIVEMDSTAEYLSLQWLGAGMHYVEDAAGPLHTVQVGSYELFKRAKIQAILQALRTGGGTFGEMHPYTELGLDFLRNHHLFAEAWAQAELEAARDGKPGQPAIKAAWDKAGEDDPELLKALGDSLAPHLTGPLTQQPWQAGEGAGSILVQTLARVGMRDGAALYDAAARAANSRLSRPGYEVKDGEVLRPETLGNRNDADVQAAERQMAEIHGRSVRRATTALRLYWQAFQKGSPDAAARRLRRTRLDYLDAQEKRRIEYMKKPPAPLRHSEKDPRWLYGEVAALVVLLGASGALAWRRRRRRVRMA